ncbi:MAG: peptidyl-prolyl cis-trans isomerase SurA, partial [Parasphingorhabdus sp.]
MPIKFIAIALTLFLGFPQIASPAVIDRVLVVVNDDVITEREFVNSMRQFIKEMRSQGNQIPDQEELEQTVMERLILERIQLQFADGLGIKITDSQVKRAVEGIAAQQNLSVPDFFRRVQQAGLDIDQYQGDVRNQLRIQRVVDREVRQQIVVSPREVELEVQRLSTDQKETEIE